MKIKRFLNSDMAEKGAKELIRKIESGQLQIQKEPKENITGEVKSPTSFEMFLKTDIGKQILETI